MSNPNTPKNAGGTSSRVHLVLSLVALIYGSTYVIAKGVMPNYLGPSAFIFVRVTIAGIVFIAMSYLRGWTRIKSLHDYKELAIAALFGVAANMLFFFNGLAHTTEMNASTLMLNAPVFVLIFSRLLLKERIRWWQTVGVLVASIGALLLIGGTGFKFSGETARGDLMVLLNATSFAFYLVYAKRILVKYDALTMIRTVFIFGWFYVLPFAWKELISADYGSFPPNVWWSIAYVSVATTCVAYLLNAWAVKHASPVITGTYIYLQPIIATGIGIAMGKPLLSVEKVIFALLVFIGVYLVSTYKRARSI